MMCVSVYCAREIKVVRGRNLIKVKKYNYEFNVVFLNVHLVFTISEDLFKLQHSQLLILC